MKEASFKESVVLGVVIAKAAVGEEKTFPLYASRPAAGFPAPGDDMVEKVLDLNDLLIVNPISTFFVRVEGDSLQGVGIFSGDMLVIDRSVSVSDGKIVLAAVYGELVVKRFVKTRSGAELVSENATYSPIKLEDSDDIFIWGVVVGSVRKFS